MHKNWWLRNGSIIDHDTGKGWDEEAFAAALAHVAAENTTGEREQYTFGKLCEFADEAASLIEHQAAEIERLRRELAKLQ